jgi:peptidoglycan/LPS O-acetylase OafA/YrhL
MDHMTDVSLRNTTKSRLTGLDTLRASAILLVLMYHYEVVVSGKPTFGFLTDIGWVGVDLFFVLSGYLIGNQIMSAIARGEDFSLKVFFARRLLRTLPNYYFILAIYFIFPSLLSGTGTASIWRFLSFTQNIGLHYGETFSHSWSLCIEEQFYLILPVAALLIASFAKSKRVGWSVLLAGVMAGMLVRSWAWITFGHNAINPLIFSEHIYYSSFARFDELLPGVAIAMLKNFHADLYARILRKGNLLLVAGSIAFAIVAYLFLNYYQIEGYGYTFGMTVFGYTLLPGSFALLTLSALSPNSWLNRVRIPGAEKLALWSYAIYLAHKPIYKLAILPLTQLKIDINAPIGIAIIMLAGIGGGWLLYRLVESPFMALRDRFFPSSHMQVQASLPIKDEERISQAI